MEINTATTYKIRYDGPDALTITSTAITLTGALTLTGATGITGALTVTGDVGITGDTTATGAVDVTGDSTFTGAVDITGDTTATGAVDVTGDSTFTGAVDVTGDSTFTGAVGVTGDSTFTGAVGVTGATTVTGDLTVTSATGTGNTYNLRCLVTDHTTDGGATTEEITGAVPDNGIIVGVTAIVTTILAGTGLDGETWSLGDGTTPGLYGTTLALAAGTTVGMTDWTALPSTHAYTNGTEPAELVMTSSVDGVFDTGVVRVSVFYYDFGTPTA